jgi:hypothetical protein
MRVYLVLRAVSRKAWPQAAFCLHEINSRLKLAFVVLISNAEVRMVFASVIPGMAVLKFRPECENIISEPGGGFTNLDSKIGLFAVCAEEAARVGTVERPGFQ